MGAKMIGIKVPYNIDGRVGGMEYVVNALKSRMQDVEGQNVVVFSDHRNVFAFDKVLVVNIFSISNLLFVLRNMLYRSRLVYFPLWHDPQLQGYYDRGFASWVKQVLRRGFDLFAVSLQAKIVRTLIVYSPYEADRFKGCKTVLVAGPSGGDEVNLDETTKPDAIEFHGVFIGRLARNKGYKAYLNLCNSYPDMKFALITPDELTAVPKNVRVFQSLSELEKQRVLSLSKCIIVPSSYESFSLVVLEAIQQRVIPVTSDMVMGNTYFKSLTEVYSFTLGSMPSMQSAFEAAVKANFIAYRQHNNDSFYRDVQAVLN